MEQLYFILVSLVALTSFLALVWYEHRRGTRFFAPLRARLDQNVERAEFILEHVDFGAFIQAEAYRIAGNIGHAAAHFSLQAVRAIERLLTRLVRRLRTQHAVELAPRESAREFVRTLSDFKVKLESTRPDAPEVH